jgi:hypothetical protein
VEKYSTYGIYTYICIFFIDQGFSKILMDINGDANGDGCKFSI